MIGLGIGVGWATKRRLVNYINELIKQFKDRVAADGGTFEAEQCLKDSLPALIENEPSLCVTPNATEAGKLFSIIPTDGVGDLGVVRNTTATYVGADGLIQTALANVPRLDYSNGSCPSILVEPQRTNLATYSEDFSNAAWSKLGTITVTTNQTTAPDGNNTADLILGADSNSSISQIYNGSIGVVYTSSFFIKNNNSTQSKLFIRNATTVVDATLNWTGSVLSSITNTVGTTTFQNYNNGWYRITSTYTSVEAAQRSRVLPTLSTNQSVYLWGAQLEVGSNATSYIPTVASAVTRNADVISKTGISDLIGQTEGALFVDFKLQAQSFSDSVVRTLGALHSGSNANRIQIYRLNNELILLITTSGINQVVLPLAITTFTGQTIKIAVSYSLNNVKLFINGVLVGTDTSATIPLCNSFNLGSNALSGDFYNGLINSSLIFKTALTNEQCIALTTP